MSNSLGHRSAAANKAQKHFAASERRAATLKDEMERERLARDVKNTRLRALRLAKEAVDREEAARRAIEVAAAKASGAAARAPRKRSAAPKVG
jgi:hypothetical protein